MNRRRPAQGTPESPGAFQRAVRSEDVKPARFVRAEAHGRPVLLTRVSGGDAVAFGPICPHRDNPMDDGSLWDDEIDCPHHHSTYDPGTGANIFPRNVFPADRAAGVLGIPVFEVVEEDGWVLVGPRREVAGDRTREDLEEGQA